MILVQNLLRQLSGNNKYIVLSLFLISFLFSCSSTKEVSPRTRAPEDIGDITEKSPDMTMDTILWTEVAKEKYPPITYDGGPRINKKDQYKALMLLPLNAQKYNSSNGEENEERFIQFYAGAKMGMEKLNEKNIPLVLDVNDSQGSAEIVQEILSSTGDNYDIMIGLYDRNALKLAAEYAEKNQVPLVSPWQASSRIAKENPYYIQLRPELKEHYEKMVREVTKYYPADQIVILKKYDGSDDNRVDYIQEYASEVLNVDNAPFREFAVESDSLILGEFYMSDLFDDEKETVFLIQNYSFDDDDFVYNCIRKLSAMKGMRKATVYGMPLLLDTDKIDFNLYKILNVKILRSKFVDEDDPEVRFFKKEFLRKFGMLPTQEAYYGYDVVTYFGNALEKFGVDFQYYLDQDSSPLLQTRFDIQRTFSGNEASDDFRDINYFMNKHLDIVEFEGNQFKVLGRYNNE